jgi:hypothetical protein
MQKPFNPLLGETYELVTNKYRLITEQVSHHPPITAFHLEASKYEVLSQQATSAKFNGRSIITQPPNRIYVVLKLPNGEREVFSSTQPTLAAHNLVIGKMYVDVSGKA